MKNTSQTTCPICARTLTVKTTAKLGAHVPRHGHQNRRGVGGGECRGSRLPADRPATAALPLVEEMLNAMVRTDKGTVHERRMIAFQQSVVDMVRDCAAAEAEAAGE